MHCHKDGEFSYLTNVHWILMIEMGDLPDKKSYQFKIQSGWYSVVVMIGLFQGLQGMLIYKTRYHYK